MPAGTPGTLPPVGLAPLPGAVPVTMGMAVVTGTRPMSPPLSEPPAGPVAPGAGGAVVKPSLGTTMVVLMVTVELELGMGLPASSVQGTTVVLSTLMVVMAAGLVAIGVGGAVTVMYEVMVGPVIMAGFWGMWGAQIPWK